VAVRAGGWAMDDQFIDLPNREQVTMMAGMTRLSAARAATGSAGRARRSRGWIGGGRTGGVAGMALELGFEVGDAGLQALLLVEEGEQDSAHGGRSGSPVGGGNAQRWRKLAHGW
jgi:hypothetical protein